MMNLTLNLSSNQLDEEDLQALTRRLYNEIKAETDIQAILPSQEVENTRGVFMELGKIVLSLFNNDSAKIFLEIIKAYINKEKSLEIMVQKPDGSVIKITGKNIETDEVERIFTQLNNQTESKT